MITVKSITIVQGTGCDKVFLHTDLPSSMWPYNESAALTLDVVADGGPRYCEGIFPNVPVKLIQPRKGFRE